MITEKLNPSYIGKRDSILSLIPSTVELLLDVGCSIGTLGEQLKLERKKIVIHGIEIDKSMSNIAKTKLDKVFVGDAELEIDFLIDTKSKYDCIVFADILEHLLNPWEILLKSKHLLNNNGKIIVSIPNINYYNTFINLYIKRYWPYEDRGIHDRTHIRFFTKKNILEMLDNAELKLEKINCHYRLIDKNTKLNKISKFLGIPFLKEFFTFQYIVLASVQKSENI